MRVTSKGQVTIPKAIREKMGILPHTEVEFDIDRDVVILRRVETEDSRGKQIVSRMRGRAKTTMSTDQIMALARGD